MRSVRIATCTSGEPVSPSWRECSLMSSCLRSAVIDIVILSKLEVKSAHDPDISVRNLHQRDWNAFQPCTMQSVLSGYPVQALTDGKRVVKGTGVVVGVKLGGSRTIKTKN